jgi:hypothetical protein
MRLLLPSGRESLSAFGFGKRRRAAKGYYVGLDVSLKSTHICVLDGERRVVWRGVSDTQIAMIAEHLARWSKQIVLVGLETGSLTPWLYHGLSDLGLPMVCMDAKPGFGCAEGSGGEDGQGGCSCASGDAGERVVLGCSCQEPGEPSTESAIGGAGSTGSGQAPALRPGPWPAAALRDQDISAGRRQVFR